MEPTYEEIRDVTLDLLAGREKSGGYGVSITQFGNLEYAVAEVLERRNPQPSRPTYSSSGSSLSHQSAELFRELFWDLFRQGIITLGYNRANDSYPFFRLTAHGERVLAGQQPYYFFDVESYERVVRNNIPQIDDLTLLYLKEAMQAFRSGCILSATVMLGVATENLFLSLLAVLEQHPNHHTVYKNVFKERTLLSKFNKFKALLEQNSKGLPLEVKEDLDTQLSGVLTVIRAYRNDSGHPSGKIIDRETCYVLLHLFISYGRKIYQLSEYFKATGATA